MTPYPNLLPHSGELYLHDHFFSQEESDVFFHELSTGIAWKSDEITMFGKRVLQPRLTAWYGDEDKSYTYSGITMHPLPWTKALAEIKSRVEEQAHANFNSALLNMYRNGNDHMGWHRDNEKQLGHNPNIASVSFGAPREFLVRNYVSKSEKVAVTLGHGCLLLMCGPMQHYWEHSLPKRKKVDGARINITFRNIL